MGVIGQSVVERRAHPRQTLQLYARINGKTFFTVEWSFGGLIIEDKVGSLQTGALVRIDGLADEEAYRKAQPLHAVDIRARVVRTVPDKKQAALSCLKLDDAAFALLQAAREGISFPGSPDALPAE